MPTNITGTTSTEYLKSYSKKGDGLQSDINSADKIIRNPELVHTSIDTHWNKKVQGDCYEMGGEGSL